MTLTANKINALETPAKRRMIRDERGLWLELHPSGRKSWRFRFTLQTRAGVINLGHYPAVSLADARKRRDELAAAVREGFSPTEQQHREKLAQERGATLQDFAERYLREVVARNRRDVAPMRRYFERDIWPLIGGKLLTKIDPDELRALIFARREAGNLPIPGKDLDLDALFPPANVMQEKLARIRALTDQHPRGAGRH